MEPISALLGYLRLAHKSVAVISEIERRQADIRNKEIRQVRAIKRAEIFSRGLHIEVLKQYYDNTALSKLGLARYGYAVDGQIQSTTMATSKSWTALQIPVDNQQDTYYLDSEARNIPRVSEDEAVAIIQDIGAEGRRVFDHPIFRLLDMKISRKKCKLELGLANFFDYVFSLGTLEDELVQALIDADLSPDLVVSNVSRQLSLRSRFLPNTGALLGLSERLCIGGSYVLLAFARPQPHNDYVFFAKRRSKEVFSGRDLITLIPMGYHQPTSIATAASELSLAYSIFREIGEEMFGRKDLDEPKGHAFPDWYLEAEPGLRWFGDNKGHFTLELVSVAFNLMQGNYEFGVLLAIHDLSYLKQYSGSVVFNWEQDDPNTPHFSTRDTPGLQRALTNIAWSDASRMTLVEGLKRLKSVDSSRVKLPVLERQV